MVEAEKARRPLDLAFDFVRRRPLRAQREGDVFPDGEVRIEPVALEDHGDAAPARRQLVDDLPINEHLAGGRLLQAGNDAQERGLSASRRSKQHHELAVARLQADAVDGIHASERLPDLVDSDRGHLDSLAVQDVAVNVAVVLKYSGAAQRACSFPDATRACPGCAVWYAVACGRAGGCAERQHEPQARAAHFRYIGSISFWAHAIASSGVAWSVAALAIMSTMMKLLTTSSDAGPAGPGEPNTARHSAAVCSTCSLSGGCELGSFDKIGMGEGTRLANSGWLYPVLASNAATQWSA